MNPEKAYALLVETNPVPDTHRVSDPADVPLRLVDDGSTPMKTIEPDIGHAPQEHRPRRNWILAAAAAVVVLLGLGALLLVTSGDDEPGEPVDQPATTVFVPEGVDPGQAAAAVAAASDFYRAVEAGDIDTAIEMTNPNGNLVADRAMWEMNAYAAANGVLGTLGECRVIGGEPGFVLAGCETTISNPVWNELGLTDALVPIRYYADGTVQWQPYLAPDGSDLHFADGNRAVVEYLREEVPEQYDAVCNPTADIYESSSVVNASGLALTRRCAEVWVPLLDEIATWVVETGVGS